MARTEKKTATERTHEAYLAWQRAKNERKEAQEWGQYASIASLLKAEEEAKARWEQVAEETREQRQAEEDAEREARMAEIQAQMLAHIAEHNAEVAEDTKTEETERALVGAKTCEAHWESEGEDELLAEAQARTARLLDGTATEEDVLGALDWADYHDEMTEASAKVAKAIAEYRWSDQTTELVIEEWRSYTDTEPTIVDVADVLAVFEHCEEHGIERPSITEAVWAVADAR